MTVTKFKTGTVEIPTVDEITKDLTLHAVFPSLAQLERALADAQRAELENTEAHQAALDAMDRCAPDPARASEYTRARAQAESTAALRPHRKRAVDAATKALMEGQQSARAALVAEGNARGEQLQAIVEIVIPVLLALRDVESALDEALTKEYARVMPMGGGSFPGVWGAEWPSALFEHPWRWERRKRPLARRA
jgi:hypothetical protein